jgi:hypothetical protein
MSIFKKLVSLFTGGSPRTGSRRTFTLYALSRRCNEPLSADVDLLNSLSQAEEGDAAYYTRKVIQGSGARRCFAQVEVELWFDSNRNLLRHEVHGGRWLSEAEYAAELARFNAPPEEEENDDPESTVSP